MENKITLATLGSKWVWIPLFVIAISIAISGWGVEGINRLASIGIAIVFCLLYLVARILGQHIFKPFAVAVIIESVSIIIWGALHNWGQNGGLLSPTNYDIATGFLIIGVLVSAIKEQWFLGALAATALFFSGSAEAYFCLGILVVAMLIRRDWSKKLWITLGIGAILVVVALILMPEFLQPTFEKLGLSKEFVVSPSTDTLAPAINRQLTMQSFRFFGYGFNMTNFYIKIPHNIVFIIIEQVGFISVGAWFIVAGYMLFKTKWKYLWISFISMGVFDHFIWTQAAPYFWVLAGVSSLNNIKNDKIYINKEELSAIK